MDYLKSVVPSQLIAERGSNIVVINPGSENIKVGLASWQTPVVIPHCIAHHMKGPMDEQTQINKKNWEQIYTFPVSPTRQREREEAYQMITSHLKVQPPNHERGRESWFRKPDYSEGGSLPWTEVKETLNSPNMATNADHQANADISDANAGSIDESTRSSITESSSSDYTFKHFICGDEALKISPNQPYFLRHPVRRGHLNISQTYSMQQISEDLYHIWDWILWEKLHLSPNNRHMFSAVLIVSETFDNREIKEMLSVVLQDLGFSSAVIHQEGIAATFGNGVASACVVNIGAQVVSILCIEDGVALPMTGVTLTFGGEDISRCLLWVEQRRQTWPPIDTDPMGKPIDFLMLNRLKETFCKFKEGDSNAPADVYYYKAGLPPDVYRVAMSALNVPSMGLFYPFLLMPDEYPPPPRPWFHDYEDMMEDSSHSEFGKRPEGAETFFSGCNYALGMQDPSQYSPKLKKEDNIVGLAEAITNSILATGRLDLYRKLFTSVLLVGGVASTKGLVDAVEQRILSAIPDHVDVDMVEVLQLRTDPLTIVWKGGAVLGILDFGRDAWIQREHWVRGGIHIGSGQKYRDSFLFQTQTSWYINN
ncbi:actin-related protein 9 [Cryptomeria japonica]|uniref:actin-related protein 9 n=1 Tax=Cryptomeria japonica TaxID=3369 RepID=UPI0027D9EF13|nr:actin-related protein 9 [Cryptomeria japonica]